MENLQEWLTIVLRGLVNNPDDIRITRTTDEQGVLYTATFNSEDVGMIIGKKGANVTLIRSLLRIAGLLIDEAASLKIDAPDLRR